MAAKLVLDTAAMQEEFFADAALIGIVSTLPVSRLCWLLNHRFDINFTRRAEMDICLQKSPAKQHYFSIYEYNIPLSETRYLLYKLKSNTEALLPELKQLDYLWLIQSSSAENDAAGFTAWLRDMPEIQLAQMITPDRLKNISHLLL
jgi:hypothetical protein